MSLKKFGQDEVAGIEYGKTYVFDKLDGTNSQVWFDGEKIQAGSRNRQLTLDNDNAGFYQAVIENKNLIDFFKKYPDIRLYGEWLVPHTLKTYTKTAWKKFYVFDVVKEMCFEQETQDFIFLTYDKYKGMLEEFGIEYIPPIAIITNGCANEYIHQLSNANFLVEDGKGAGEGVVIKNYDFVNKFGRIVWAKIVTNEFKSKHRREMGAIEKECEPVELKIVEEFMTEALIEKEYSKIVHEEQEWTNKMIPRLLATCYHCLVVEELWDAVKKYKNPVINFKTLQAFAYKKVKEVKSNLF